MSIEIKSRIRMRNRKQITITQNQMLPLLEAKRVFVPQNKIIKSVFFAVVIQDER